MTARRSGSLHVGALTALVVALLATCGARVAAQSASAPELTAAFIYNFAKFAVWPADALGLDAPMILCVADDGAVADALARTTKNSSIGGHPIETRRVHVDLSARACHLLYASGLDVKRSARLLDLLKGAPVLTVSDFTRFAPLGGVSHFFVESGKMRFAINVESAQRARVTLSSKLLSLAKIVKDDRYVAYP